jgi:hypothetical protein
MCMVRIMKRILAIAGLIAVCVLAGCSSGKHKAASATSAPSASPTPSFTTTYGQDAALIASHMPDCTGLASGDIGGGGASGMVAKATCTMLGHEVIIYTWKDAASQSTVADVMNTGTLKYYAEGTGWTEILGEDNVAPDAQKQIADNVAKDLGGTSKSV